MRWFGDPKLQVEAKSDLTPVTVADRAVEDAWRERLGRDRPHDDVLGEERGGGQRPVGTVARRWVLDPIDGTKNYVRGVPVWASLVALEREENPVVGVVSAPALGRRWWASRGGGAWESGRRLRVSTIDRLDDAFFSYDSLDRFDDPAVGARWLAFARSCARSRGLGDFWSHVLVAEGAIDVAAEPEVAHWDVAAVKVIVEEAGGRFSDLSGRPGADGGSAVSSNGFLHEAVLSALADETSGDS